MERHLVFPGPIALSDFRRHEAASKLGVPDVRAQFLHYVCLEEVVSSRDLPSINFTLRGLLDYGEQVSEDFYGDASSEAVDTFYVFPRFGTISPWSSKATSIAHVCGLKHQVFRIERGTVIQIKHAMSQYDKELAAGLLHDRMTQKISPEGPDLHLMFKEYDPAPIVSIPIHANGLDPVEVLMEANKKMGLALDATEIDYLLKAFALDGLLPRDPTDVELFMFSQINSEHCRHKQFNASWTIDGEQKPHSLFGMIRNTHKRNPKFTISAYSDNAAVFDGVMGSFFAPNLTTFKNELRFGEWKQTQEAVPYLGKVETHNHPTSVVPFEGAATGSGGEIRDEGSVGRGSRSKAGLCGFAVSDLLIPTLQQPWELPEVGYPGHVATSLDIMIDAPLGSAAFNNEFGRPCLNGYFRTLLTKLETHDRKLEIRGYHKPIMLAGGIGTVRPQHALKNPGFVKPGSYVAVIGGPAMLIGLGGGAASSQTSAEESKELDFASVQRGNAEVQRRAQEVINACTAMGLDNPITFIHDTGAGGLSNSLSELLHDTQLGATFELREIDNADRGMSPMQIWCNEAQERYVVAVNPESLHTFKFIADRERCCYSIVGRTEGGIGTEHRLALTDREATAGPLPIDMPLSTLFGEIPKLSRNVESRKLPLANFDASLKSYLPDMKGGLLEEAIRRVLQLPSVASKMFLITIADRTVGGLTCRDQLVGKWQTPVADCSVTATSLTPGLKTGEAMAMGEKPTLAFINPAASAKMAVAEALLNIAAADLKDGLERIRMSANWMTAINAPGEAAAIYEAVEAIGMDLCPQLGISIPVGKDSTSMRMIWKDSQSGEPKSVTAPLTAVVTAFAPVNDTVNTWTPALHRSREDGIGETILLLVDLADGHRALGGSALAQVFNQVGDESPDVRNVQLLKDYFDAIEQLHEAGIVLAYHDISDGGLLACIVEMAIAGRCSVNLFLDNLCHSTEMTELTSSLFTEELGAVFQVRKSDEINFIRCFATCGPPRGLIKKIGQVAGPPSPLKPPELTIYHGASLIYSSSLRDNPECAEAEYDTISDNTDPGLSWNLTFDPASDILPLTDKVSSFLSLKPKPRVAILREQGVNGQSEMAFAFMSAGFTAVDVHMTDLIAGRQSLKNFVGLAGCGGFSFGDTLGAGRGWASSVSLNSGLREEFKAFFRRPETFAIGVCNGCQFLTQLAQQGGIIPGTKGWPVFTNNTSAVFEARYSMCEVLGRPSTPSVFFHGMKGSKMPIAVSHAEGRAVFPGRKDQNAAAQDLLDRGLVAVRYLDNHLQPTEAYPANPNGSPSGIAGVLSSDGRVLAMMPHPERTVMRGVGSWIPRRQAQVWNEGPWARLFKSAKRWVV